MKKLLLLSSLFMVLLALPSQLEASSKSEQKKEMRKAKAAAEAAETAAIIKSQNYDFVTTKLISSGVVRLSNIPLNPAWSVKITPNSFRCLLPIYGSKVTTGQPSLLRNLNIFTRDFEIEQVQGKNGGWSISVEVTDTSSNTDYKFEFLIPSSGMMGQLMVSTDFDAPVTFQGDLRGSSISK